MLLGTLLPLAAAADKGQPARSANSSSFFKALIPADPVAGGSRRFDRADIRDLMAPENPMDPWMRSRFRAANRGRPAEDPWVNRYLPGDTGTLPRMNWQSIGGAEDLIDRYNALGNKMKSSLFGRGLSRNLEIELDGSPEIKYRVEFD